MKIDSDIKHKLRLPILCAIVLMVGLAWVVIGRGSNPLPNDLKDQVKFSVVYPKKADFYAQEGSYAFQNGTLTYKAVYKGLNMTVTEQAAPVGANNNGQINTQALGLHPYLQFQSNKGPVALTNIYNTDKYYSAEGQLAVLIAGNSLIFIHPDASQKLTNEQWLDLINSLSVAK